MKKLLTAVLLTTAAAWAADPLDVAYDSSRLGLVAGITVNIAKSFEDKRITCRYQRDDWDQFATNPTLRAQAIQNPCQYPTQDLALFQYRHVDYQGHPFEELPFLLEPHRPISRTVTVSLGTVGALVAEHYIAKKWPRTRKWLSVVNFSVGGGVAYAGVQSR